MGHSAIKPHSPLAPVAFFVCPKPCLSTLSKELQRNNRSQRPVTSCKTPSRPARIGIPVPSRVWPRSRLAVVTRDSARIGPAWRR
ncbi:hypothetical protein BJX62DRAFT_196174 [Aspergillus germanicus]